MSPVLCVLSSANFLISSATTANPLPDSPALAASMEAFNDSKLVWLVIFLMILTASFIFALELFVARVFAGDLLIYFRIMMPLSKPMIATLSLFTALGYWNDWYNCMLFISDDKKYNLQYTLQNLLRSAEFITKIAYEQGRTVASVPSESMKLAMTVIAIGPIIMLYPFLQKYFVKGMTIGSVKG